MAQTDESFALVQPDEDKRLKNRADRASGIVIAEGAAFGVATLYGVWWVPFRVKPLRGGRYVVRDCAEAGLSGCFLPAI
jgi:hypothetical protein